MTRRELERTPLRIKAAWAVCKADGTWIHHVLWLTRAEARMQAGGWFVRRVIIPERRRK